MKKFIAFCIFLSIIILTILIVILGIVYRPIGQDLKNDDSIVVWFFENKSKIKQTIKEYPIEFRENLIYLKEKIEDLINQKEEKKFTFWTIQLKPVYEDEIKNIISGFEKKHNIKVVWVDIPIAEAQKRTLASVLGENPPDLVNLNPDFSLLLAQRGVLEYFSQNETSLYPNSLLEKLKYKNNIYALPFYATSPTTIYNKEIFKKCALNLPKTYDDIYKIAPEIKSCAHLSALAINLNENDTLAKILNKYDIYDFKDEKQLNSAKNVYRMFDDMYKNEYLPKDTLNINHREVIEKYMSNQAAVVVLGSNFINMIKQNALSIYEQSDLSQQLTGSNGAYDVALMNLIIPKRSKNISLAKEFALILTNKENQMKLSKKTNVLPVNKYALSDDYFKNCSSDLVEKSRCIGARQLQNLNTKTFSDNNKKTINEELNGALEKILLNNSDIDKSIEALSEQIKILNQR